MTPFSVNVYRSRLTAPEYIAGILRGERAVLARAVTLVESDLPADSDLASEVLEGVLPHSGSGRRVGISGVPGAGKSMLIDRLGMHLIHDRGEKVAVLTVDPSSPVSGGSILGDKTRMGRLSTEENAFIRPSPARGHLGGVTRRSRETMLLCEAAGYQNVLIETVGVGQSEAAVRSMTDFFLVVLIGGAGDELQGIKRGILEMIDALAINKADGEYAGQAEISAQQYRSALHLLAGSLAGWHPKVLTVSALTGKGVQELWDVVLEHRAQLETDGALCELRKGQAREWMHELIRTGLVELLHRNPAAARLIPSLEAAVENGSMMPSAAAHQILSVFRSNS